MGLTSRKRVILTIAIKCLSSWELRPIFFSPAKNVQSRWNYHSLKSKELSNTKYFTYLVIESEIFLHHENFDQFGICDIRFFHMHANSYAVKLCSQIKKLITAAYILLHLKILRQVKRFVIIIISFEKILYAFLHNLFYSIQIQIA